MKPRKTPSIPAVDSSIARVIMTITLLSCAAVPAVGGELYPPGAPAPTMKNLQELFDQAGQANRAVGGGDVLLFLPYVLERPGSVSDTLYTFDTTIELLATRPFVGQGLKSGNDTRVEKDASDVAVHLYLYNTNGDPVLSGLGTEVANPATFTLGPASPKVTVQLESLFQAAGGFPAAIYVGFAILSIDSGDWKDVAVEAFLAHSHGASGDLDITSLEPVRIQDSPIAPAKDAASPASGSNDSEPVENK